MVNNRVTVIILCLFILLSCKEETLKLDKNTWDSFTEKYISNCPKETYNNFFYYSKIYRNQEVLLLQNEFNIKDVKLIIERSRNKNFYNSSFQIITNKNVSYLYDFRGADKTPFFIKKSTINQEDLDFLKTNRADCIVQDDYYDTFKIYTWFNKGKLETSFWLYN